MNNHTSKLIELLVNNKKKKKPNNDNVNLRDKILEILEILINRDSQTMELHHHQDLKILLIEFFNLYIVISINIRLYHFCDIEHDIHHILDTIIDSVIERSQIIKNNELTMVLNLVKDKREKLEFINVDKIT